MKINFRKLNPEAQVPSYESAQAAGMDIRAMITHEIFLQPGVRFTCPTGIAIELPDGFECQVRPRSGLARKHGVTVLNAPGTIDPDYRSEICVILINHGDTAFKIEPFDRIAQLVIAPFVRAELIQVGELSQTERGDGAFGSTGVK